MYATVRRKLSVCRFLPKSYGFYSYIFRQPQRTGGPLSSIELPPSTMDASDQAGASLPYWTLGLFSPGSGLARMNRQNPYRRGPSTSDIHCGDLHRRRCIGPDFPLDR